jgi:hypothetical protein
MESLRDPFDRDKSARFKTLEHVPKPWNPGKVDQLFRDMLQLESRAILAGTLIRSSYGSGATISRFLT